MKNLKAIASDTANLISSSQVITCLENAIKELVENSIDAGAATIEVRLAGFGTELITVVDNASGISVEQQSKFGQRHCTSKIAKFDDIETASSFGFRGEAIRYYVAYLKLSMCSMRFRNYYLYRPAPWTKINL
jgi:DNA mismatch repair protein PMS2